MFFLFIALFASNALFGQTTKPQMQKMYSDYLKENGYSPQVAADGSLIIFDDRNGNGYRYVIFVNDESSKCFQMGRYDKYLGEGNYWDKLNEAKKSLESYLKDITVVFDGGRDPGGWFMANVALKKPDDFKRVFTRIVLSLRVAEDLFYVELLRQRGE